MTRHDPQTQEEFVKKYTKKSETSYWILRAFFYPLACLLFHPKAYGAQKVPDGPVILAGNHRNAPDPAFLVKAIKHRAVRFLAKKSLHDGPFGFLFDWFLTVPVDRSRHTPEVMEAADVVLQNGGMLGIFPEGTRNKTEEILLPFKYGVVKLAQKNNAWIVPLVNVGKCRPFFSRMETYFGEPYKIAKDADLKEENEKLRKIIYDMYIEHAKQDERVDKIRAQLNKANKAE